MRIITTIAAALVCAALAAEEMPSVLTTLFSDGSTNSWTQADLQAALQLTNRKYHRDMGKRQGRIDWHGKIVRSVVNTNELTLVEYHEDGYAHTNAATAAALVTPDARSREIAATARRERIRLAQDRKRRARIAELSTNFAAQVKITMADKHWPAPLATEYLRYELQTLIGTNTVTITTEVH